ncbi:MAG: ABC transporter permease [bacterium]|nr:ABC transporter permease [bacterium]
MIEDLLKYIADNIAHRFTRSFLTILSILIGIMAVFVLISYGQGLEYYIDQTAKEVGTDKLIAQPRGAGAPGSTGTYLSKSDFDFLKKQKGVSEAAGSVVRQSEIKIDKDKLGKWVFIMGIPTEADEQRLMEEAFAGYGLLEGRELKKGDSKKVVLGYSYMFADKIFSKALKRGDKIFIKDQSFEIVGFYEEVGNAQDDANVYLTNNAMEELFEVEDKYDYIFIRTDKGEDPTELADRLEDKLRKKKGQKEGEEDFYIQSYAQLLESFSAVLLVLNVILVIIAGISVVVAAVNIMNTMYTAVLERTKEIGIMKSIGASNRYILLIFFMESGILGLIGGSLGVLIGFGLAKLGAMSLAAVGYSFLQPYFPAWLIIGCLLFSFLIGAASGFLPARAASKLKPVDALRYE